MFFASCAEGGLVRCRADLSDAIAREVEALLAESPPWTDPRHPPAAVGRVQMKLNAPPPVVSLIHELPPQPPSGSDATFVRSGTPPGDRLLAGLGTGIPDHLVEAGFATVADLWPPWCVAVRDGVIAAVAFAARTGPKGRAVGVYTFRAFRRRGLASAVTAEWSQLPALAGRPLFYSTTADNLASQGVIGRLGLPRIGLGLRFN